MWKARVSKMTSKVNEAQALSTQSINQSREHDEVAKMTMERMASQIRDLNEIVEAIRGKLVWKELIIIDENDDLKYNYRDAVRQNIEYEEIIQQLARNQGLPVDQFIKGSNSRL
jgi:hypothetical protein